MAKERAVEPSNLQPSSSVDPTTIPDHSTSDRDRLLACFSAQTEWTRVALLSSMGVGRYRTDQALRDALSRGLIEKRGRTRAAVFAWKAPKAPGAPHD